MKKLGLPDDLLVGYDSRIIVQLFVNFQFPRRTIMDPASFGRFMITRYFSVLLEHSATPLQRIIIRMGVLNSHPNYQLFISVEPTHALFVEVLSRITNCYLISFKEVAALWIYGIR